MIWKFSKNPVFWATFILGLTFFAFIDDRYRSFDDTNQYFVEARAYVRGSRPPVKALTQDVRLLGIDAPTHTPPLTAYTWSLLNNSSDHRQTMWNVKFYQACLLFFSFMTFIFVLGGRRFIFDALIIGILVFLNEFSRSMVFAPVSEGASIALLIASYAWPQALGVLTPLQVATRHPVALVHGALLWRNKKNLKVIISGLMVTLGLIAFFRELLIPSKLQHMAPTFGKAMGAYKGLIQEWAYLFFNHLLPDETQWFQILWGIIVGVGFIALVYKSFKSRVFQPLLIWGVFALYCLVILIPFSAGVRYFFPLFLFLLFEFKPTLPRQRWLRGMFIVLAIHLTIQQVAAIAEFRRYPVPETDRPGYAQAKDWLHERGLEKSRIMMFGRRFCVHYFDTECFGIGGFTNLEEIFHNDKIDFVLITGLQWNSLEKDFKERLLTLLKTKKYNVETHKKTFQDGVELIDLRGL